MTYPPTWKWLKHGKVLEGTYVGAFPAVGKGGRSVLYAIKDKSGKTWTIWGVNEIKQALQLRPFGKKVYFKYLGQKKTKKGFMSHHFEIHVGRGGKAADPTNTRGPVKKHRAAVASHTPARQALTRPLMPVGRGSGHGSATRKVLVKKKKRSKPEKGRWPIVVDVPQPPPGYNADPPPVPPAAADSFLEGWKKRLKKV